MKAKYPPPRLTPIYTLAIAMVTVQELAVQLRSTKQVIPHYNLKEN